MAIPNLYQSFGKNCWKKLRTAIFGHSKFVPVFLGKNWNGHWPFQKIRWNSHFWPFQIYTSQKFWGKLLGKKIGEQPFLAIPNLYQSFWEKLSEKIENSHFWPFQICTSPVWEKLLEKIWNSHFWPFQIYTSLLGKIVGKNSEQPFLANPNLYQSF